MPHNGNCFKGRRQLDVYKITIIPPTTQQPYPSIKLNTEFRASFEVKWKNALILKVLGHSITYIILLNKITQLWKLKWEFSLMELMNDFFLFRSDEDDTIDPALTEGPWLVAENYLTIQRWQPRFNASKGTITTMFVWVFILEFLEEFYNEDILFSVGHCIGHSLKFDVNTYWATRWKYTWLCVEIDYLRHVVKKVFIDDLLFNVKYENFPSICFYRGRIGHRVDNHSTTDIGLDV